MTPEFWVEAETFYETELVALGMLLFFFVVVALMMWMYRTPKTKKLLCVPVAVMVLMVGAGVAGHTRYHPYLEQATIINPLVRDRKRHFLGYTYFSTREQAFFRQMNDSDALRQSDLYEEKRVEEAVEYLGVDGALYFFENEDGELFKVSSTDIKFQERAEQAKLVGSRFVLKDSGFEEIGFKNPPYVMFENIMVPASEEFKTYDAGFAGHIPETNRVFTEWVF